MLQWHSTLSRRIGTSPDESSSWRLRCSQELDHWASFHDSFAAMVGLIQAPAFFDNQIATPELEDRSATITFQKGALDASRESNLRENRTWIGSTKADLRGERAFTSEAEL
jgi:hypothetical protein